MRTSLLVGLLVAIAALAAAPSASAAPSSLRFDIPTLPLPAEGVVPINVTLRVQDFSCQEPHAFTVQLFANATEGISLAWAASNVTFAVPADAYFVRPYEATATVDLTVHALNAGDAELTALFSSDDAGCWAAGGFAPAQTTILVRVEPEQQAPAPQEPAPEAPEPTPASPASEPEPAPAPTPSSRAEVPVCGPDGNCGSIGEYEPPGQESAIAESPGLGLVGALAALGAGAFALRRRKP